MQRKAITTYVIAFLFAKYDIVALRIGVDANDHICGNCLRISL